MQKMKTVTIGQLVELYGSRWDTRVDVHFTEGSERTIKLTERVGSSRDGSDPAIDLAKQLVRAVNQPQRTFQTSWRKVIGDMPRWKRFLTSTYRQFCEVYTDLTMNYDIQVSHDPLNRFEPVTVHENMGVVAGDTLFIAVSNHNQLVPGVHEVKVVSASVSVDPDDVTLFTRVTHPDHPDQEFSLNLSKDGWSASYSYWKVFMTLEEANACYMAHCDEMIKDFAARKQQLEKPNA